MRESAWRADVLAAAYLNTTGTSTGSSGFDSSLVLDLSSSTVVTPGLYGIAVPDLGELYGVSSNVVAVKDYQEFDFEVVDGKLPSLNGSVSPLIPTDEPNAAVGGT